jgi:GDP-L-fucose synthase
MSVIINNKLYPADFITENLQIETNIIKSSFDYKVKKLLNLGSICIFPKMCPQPIKEEYLLSNYLESTNEGYALAKISGIKLCQAYNKQYNTNFISAMPCSLFGEGDNFDTKRSHLIPAIMKKMYEAKVNGLNEVEIWGTGNPRREFLYIDDLADACLFLMNNYNSSEIINVGSGYDITIKEIAHIIRQIVGFEGELKFNTDMPDGTMRKLLDVSKINNLGWKHNINFVNGLYKLYNWYLGGL